MKSCQRIETAVAALWFTLLNTLNIYKYWCALSEPCDHYHRLFVSTWHVAGYDPLTYEVLSSWTTAYNVYRHPLLAFFLWPLNQVNQGLMWLTGVNCAVPLMALLLIVAGTLSFVLLRRILTDIVGTSRGVALALCAMYFTFGHVMLTALAPDHFALSQPLLLLTLYIAGRGKPQKAWHTVALFVATAGISLNNGLKVYLADLFTRGWRTFRPLHLLLVIALPAALMWGFARWEYRTFVWPHEMARHEAKVRKDSIARAALWQTVADTAKAHDSTTIAKAVKDERQRRAVAKFRADHKRMWNVNTGKPMGKGEFMRWTDKTTSRLDVAVENLFGEAVQLHRQHALEDVLRTRPMLVRYGTMRYVNYAAEAALLLLFAAGIWCGRRRRFMWLALSFFALDMALHLGLGFGINEVYIMTAGYMFAVPIVAAYALPRKLVPAVWLLALWLAAWNLAVIIPYFVC